MRLVNHRLWKHVVLGYLMLAIAVFVLYQTASVAANGLNWSRFHEHIVFHAIYLVGIVGIVAMGVIFPRWWINVAGAGLIVTTLMIVVNYPVGSPLVDGYALAQVAIIHCPAMLIAAMLTYLGTIPWRRVRSLPLRESCCAVCGYPQRGLQTPRCPECGATRQL